MEINHYNLHAFSFYSLLRDDHDSLMICFKVVKSLVKGKFLAILEVISCGDSDVKETYSLKKIFLISDEAVHSSLREHRFLKHIATLKLKTSFLTTLSTALSKMDHQCFFLTRESCLNMSHLIEYRLRLCEAEAKFYISEVISGL